MIMMTSIFDRLEVTRGNEARCLMFAAGVHALLLLWNPILLKSDFHAIHDFVTVDVVEQSGSPLLVEQPKRMSFMDTLKDMLMAPKADSIAHSAPSIAQRIAAPLQPLLKETKHLRPMSSFLPHTQTEDLAAMRSPDQIRTPGPKNPALPLGGPALQGKSFGGIRVKDLPFQVSGPESVSASNVSAIPIAIGNNSAKSGLGYAAPALQESKHRTLSMQPGAGLGGRGEAMGLATTAAAPSQIALAGTGGSGTAPTGAAAGGGYLQERGGGGSGGGLVSRALMGGSGGGFGVGGVGQIPAAAQQLDNQISQSGPGRKSKQAFELVGPLTNRGILKKVIPQYPDWAEEQGIMGSVRLYFTVDSQGRVRSAIRVTKTTGYPQLDQLGIDALKQWSFTPLNNSDDSTGEWGIITFNFSLAS